jgi:hypothetical protein
METSDAEIASTQSYGSLTIRATFIQFGVTNNQQVDQRAEAELNRVDYIVSHKTAPRKVGIPLFMQFNSGLFFRRVAAKSNH